MTPSDLRAVLERGTPGPWVWTTDGKLIGRLSLEPILGNEANEDLIALSVNLAPLLLELWDAVNEECARIHRVGDALAALANWKEPG